MLNVGIAGFRHGHIFSLCSLLEENPKTNVIGAWEDDDPSREIAEERTSIIFKYDNYEQMLKDPEVDAVAIGSYYGIRGEMAIRALKAGKHVISDKPLCTSLAELDEIIKLSKEKGLSVGLMLDLRYSGNVLAARNIIKNGMLGEIHNIQFGGQHPLMYGVRPSWYFEEGKHCGVINDIAIHGIDLISYLTGLEVKNVIGARCWNAYAVSEPNFKDCGQFMLELSNSAGVIGDVSYAVPNTIGFNSPHYWEFRIWGSKGMLAFSENTKGVNFYQEGNSTAKEVSPIKAETDYLDAFVSEIEGSKAVSISTDEVFHSSKATLLIQQKANNNN